MSKPPIRFKCDGCGAINEGDEHEFTDRHTMPPTWSAKCGHCKLVCVVSPTPLTAQAVGNEIEAHGIMGALARHPMAGRL